MKTTEKILKISIVIILLLNVVALCAQGVTLNVSQDARLLMFGDDKGNKAGTLDIAISSEWRTPQNNFGYFFIRPEFEIAELKGGTYKRYSANVGITLNQIIENVGFTSSLGYGVIDYNMARRGFGANFQTSYEVAKGVELFVDMEVVDRQDLRIYGVKYTQIENRIRASGKLGVKVLIFDNSKY